MKRTLAVTCLLLFVLSGCSLFSQPQYRDNPMDPISSQSTEQPDTPPASYSTYYVVNCEENIPMYTYADVTSAELCKLPLGASVSYIQTAENGFCKIIYQGVTGFAFASNLSETAPDTTHKEYVTYYVVNCNEYITLRTQPDTSASAVCRLPLGASVSYVSTADNGFYKVIYNGKTGYALSSYLSQDPDASHAVPPSSSTSSTTVYATCYVVNCQESITLRTSPSTKASEIRQIPLGAAVSYVGTASNGFYKVIYNGKTGYALASYLSFSQPAGFTYSTRYMTVVNCQQSITLRTAPTTKASEICQMPLGSVVEYLGPAENGFLAVAYNGRVGYALANYLR